MEEHVKTSEVDFNQSENRFSLLKWFKRCRDRVISSNPRISSCESVESGQSTETTNSFIVYFRTSLISGKFRSTKDYQEGLESLDDQSKFSDGVINPEKRTKNPKQHVKGKRRAPNPPGTVSKPQTAEKVTKKKRRPAPKPPRDTTLQQSEKSASVTMPKINSALSKNPTNNLPSNSSRKNLKLFEEIVKKNPNDASTLERAITDSSTASEATKEEENFIIDVTNRLTALQEALKRPPVINNDNPGFNKPTTIPNIQKTTLKNRPDVLKLATQQNVGNLPTKLNITDGSRQNTSKTVEKTGNGESKNLETKQKNTHENLRSSVDDSTLNLKEMLKEMKHSLSRTPKPRKIINNLSIIENKDITRDKLPYRHEMNYAVVNNPPIVQFAHPKTPKNDFLPNKKRYNKTQKVSSGVQTSKDVVKINSELKTDEKIVDSLIKDTFELIKPSEFAAIRRGIKNTKKTDDTNPYVNIINQSLYANTVGLSENKYKRLSSHGVEREKDNKINPSNPTDTAAILGHSNSVNVDWFFKNPQSSRNNRKSTSIMAESMELLAVNELLQKLEDAISSGKHKEAADCAKELARLKIQCSVKHHEQNKTNQLLYLDMFIEDRLHHQGPIPLQVAQKMTVLQLKEKISAEYEIPPIIQHWIIGKNLLANDQATMEDLNVVEGSSIFLYLVAPDVQAENPAGNHPDLPRESTVDVKKAQQELEKIPTGLVDSLEAIPSCSKTEVQKDLEDVIELNLVAEKISPVPEKPSGPKEYEVLMMLENSGLVLNETEFECPICFVIYGQHEGVILRDCVHTFCRTCLENTIKHCSDAEVKCPFRNDSYACESTLQEREIKSLVDVSIYEQHLHKSIAVAENNAGHNAFHCKTPDCRGWCICDDNVNHFLCPVCDMTNCLTCRVIHDGKNCWEYQEDMKAAMDTDYESKKTAEMIKEMLARGDAMNCPTCSVVLMKKMGCDWLKCSMCKTEICWVTKGPRWGPGGPGDTMGGCQCGLYGKKCHPQCSYCH